VNTAGIIIGLAVTFLGVTATVAQDQPKDEPSPPQSNAAPQAVSSSRNPDVVLPRLAKFTPALGLPYIREVLGEPDMDIGSASSLFIYRLSDGSTLQVRISPYDLATNSVLHITRQSGQLAAQKIYHAADPPGAPPAPTKREDRGDNPARPVEKASPARQGAYADFVAFVHRTSDFHEVTRRGEKLFRPGVIIPDHPALLKGFPVQEDSKGIDRYQIFSFDGPAGAGVIYLSVEKKTGKIIKFLPVEGRKNQ
jgi:hypothetical protein